MARRVKDALLDGRTARDGLKPSGKPYFRALEHGLHLGYRKPLSGPGKWIARHYLGNRDYATEVIGEADDFSDADGTKIINYDQAIKRAREKSVDRAHAAAGRVGPLTVAAVMRTYLEFLETDRKSAVSARYSINAHILPDLGRVEVQALTKDRLKQWHTELAKRPIRLRTKQGDEPRFKRVDNSPDGVRRRKSTANRILKILKGALNFAWLDGKVPSDAAWRRVTPFKGVESARIRYLTVVQSQRLRNAADLDFGRLVEAALQTGARYGELSKMVVSDLNADVGTVAVPDSKGGKPRHIVLTDEGLAFFKEACAGRPGEDLMFRKHNGTAWGKGHQQYLMKELCKRASVSSPIGFHILRHTYASHCVMNGVPLLVLAKNLGHSDTKMVELHYGHMSPSHVADAIRAGAPRFGTAPDPKIATMLVVNR